MLPPEAIFTVSLMLPVPVEGFVVSEAPPAAVTVNVSLVMSGREGVGHRGSGGGIGAVVGDRDRVDHHAAGRHGAGSRVILEPPLLSVLVIARLAARKLSVSLADLLVAGVKLGGGVTLAVLVIEPVAEPLMWAVKV